MSVAAEWDVVARDVRDRLGLYRWRAVGGRLTKWHLFDPDATARESAASVKTWYPGDVSPLPPIARTDIPMICGVRAGGDELRTLIRYWDELHALDVCGSCVLLELKRRTGFL